MDAQKKTDANLIPGTDGIGYVQFFENLKRHHLYHEISQSVRSTIAFVPKANWKSRDQLFKIKWSLPCYSFKQDPKQAQKHTRACLSPIGGRVYICFDCQETNRGFLCQKCFMASNHQVKCRYQIKQVDPVLENFYRCGCGDYSRMSFRGTCPDHKHIHTRALPSFQKAAIQECKEYIGGCLKLLVVLVQTVEAIKRKNVPDQQLMEHLETLVFSNYGRGLFELLKNTNKSYEQYLEITQECLLEQMSKSASSELMKPEAMPILCIILQIYGDRSDSFLYDCIGQLLRLENKALLACLFAHAVRSTRPHLLARGFRQIKHMKSLMKICPDLFCQLVRQFSHQIEAISKEEALQLYVFAATPDMYLFRKQKHQNSLVECFESLYKKSYLTIENILLVKTSSILGVLSNLVYEEKLFSAMLGKLIDYTHNKLMAKYVTKNEGGRKISLSEMCNVITKLVYLHLEGDWTRSADFLFKLDLNSKIITIISYYVLESLGNTSHLSLQTVVCFGTFLNKAKEDPQLYQNYRDFWQNPTFECEKFVDVLAKMLNILIGQQLKSLSKSTAYRETSQEERQEIEKIQEQKLRELLFMQKEIPFKQMQILQKENILNFRRADEIVSNYTTFNENSRVFVYSHTETHFNFDGIANGLLSPKFQADGLVFHPSIDDHCFVQAGYQHRRSVIEAILSPIFSNPNTPVYKSEKLDPKLLKTITKNQDYVRYVCFIIVDKITNGGIKELRNFLLDSRVQLIKSKASQEPTEDELKLYKLFGVDFTSTKELLMQIEQQQGHQLTDDPSKQQNKQVTLEAQGKQEAEHGSKQQMESNVQSPAKSEKGSKLQKLREKFQLKQAFVLGAYSSPGQTAYRQNVEICMTCKEENHPDNALFYLGVLKKQSPENRIFHSSYSSNYSMSLCMHLIHEACYMKLMNGSSFTCPLCKVSSNILFPLENHQLSERTVEFLENKLTYAYIQLFGDYHADRCFVFLMKNIISEALFYIIFNVILEVDNTANISKVQINKKIDFYLRFLTSWWKIMPHEQRQYQMYKIAKLFTDSHGCNHNNTDPKAIIDQIIMNSVWAKIVDENRNKKIYPLLNALQNVIEGKEFKTFMAYLEEFIGSPMCYQLELMKGPALKPKFINHYFNPPSSIALLEYHTRSCSQCKSSADDIEVYYCLYCSLSYCQKCAHEKTHGNLRARINGKNGCFEYNNKKGGCFDSKIYMNAYRQEWGAVAYGHDDYFAYSVNQSQMNKALYEWMRQIRN